MELTFHDAKVNGVILDVGNSWKLILNSGGSWENETLGALRVNRGTLYQEHAPGGKERNRRLVGTAWIGEEEVRMFQFDYFFVATFSYYERGTGTLFQAAVKMLLVPGWIRWRAV